MKLMQLSLFLENKPGALSSVCRVLKENNLSISTLQVADTKEYGILRLLVAEWERAVQVLEAAGFVVKTTEVLALPVADRPGGLAELLEIADRNELSVEYMYAFTFGSGKDAVIVFRFDKPELAAQVLEDAGMGGTINIFDRD